MNMRKTLNDINNEINHHKEIIKSLENEKEVFRKNCPHPEYFLTVKTSDNEDDCLGPGIYENTSIYYKCSLCEGNFYGIYDKNQEGAPTINDILESQK